DGSRYILNGEKRYITNTAIAQVLTVMARTPVPGKPGKDAITAFLVTPDMPGFDLLDGRMGKVGIRGTATGKFALRNVKVPKENILGPLGKGLKVALTVLDFGRTTFGACCTGAAKTCLDLAVKHANTRKQFNKTLGNFHLVQKKIAVIAANAYAMEAMTSVTAALIDRGLEDYMLETAMLKVFTTELLWECVNEAFQIHGGAAYMTDCPLERMLRDARINQIGEGSNEVLKSFIALVGMHGPGMEVKEIYDTMLKPTREGGYEPARCDGPHAGCPGAQLRIEIIRQSARSLDLEIQFRGQQIARPLSRTDPRHAARAGADRGCSDGSVCLGGDAEPMGFRDPDRPKQRPIARAKEYRSRTLPAPIVSTNPDFPGWSRRQRRQIYFASSGIGARFKIIRYGPFRIDNACSKSCVISS